MKINKELKKAIKANYSRNLYKIAKKTILPATEEHYISKTELFHFLDYLSELENNKQDLNEMVNLYTQNPKVVKFLDSKLAESPDKLKKYLDIFGEETLEDQLEIILNLNIEHPNLEPILPYLKDNEELFSKLIKYQYYLEQSKQRDIPGEIIANNFDKYIQVLNKNLLTKLEDTEVINYLSLDDESVSKFNTWYDSIQSSNITFSKKNIGYTDGDFVKTILCKYLIQNPHQIDKFIMGAQTSNNIFYLMEFLENSKDETIKDNLIHILINSELDFDNQKNLLFGLVYPEDPFLHQLNELIRRQEKNNSQFPNEVSDYIECFHKLINSKCKDDLIEFYEQLKHDNLISHKAMEEYIITEYNKHLDGLLSKTESIAKSDKVTTTKEIFASKQYNKTGEIQIYTLHDMPFVCLGHSIEGAKMDEHHPDEYQEKKDFTDKLCKSPHLWTSSPDHGTNYISMSLDAAHKMKTFNYGNLYLGFNKVHEKQIKFSSKDDAATPMKRGTTIENTINFTSPEDIIARKSVGYCEFGSDRADITPDFLVVTTTQTQTGLPLLTEQTKEWALYYDIPIFVLDSQSYLVGNYTRLKNYLEELKNSPNIPTYDEIETLLFLQESTNIYTEEQEQDKYPELKPSFRFDILLSIAQADNKQWTLENIENAKHLCNKLAQLSNGPEKYQQLEQFRMSITQKAQRATFENNSYQGGIGNVSTPLPEYTENNETISSTENKHGR